MRPWKWELWPWNWRKVRKARISKEDRDLFERYGESVIGSILAGDIPIVSELRAILPHSPPGQPTVNSDKFEEARNWLTECRDAHERREQRLETVEIGVVALITIEIFLSLYFGFRAISDGRQQDAILQQMNKNTADTALQIQRAADATTASLEILRQERADRAKKPSPALYVGNIPIDKATIRPTVPNGPTQSIARLDLLLKNEGDAPLSTSEIHALVPEGINIVLSPVPPVPEYEEPSKPGTRTTSYWVPLTPVGKSLRIDCQIFVPKGHAPFKVTFTITTPQLQAVTPLGSLTVLPPKP